MKNSFLVSAIISILFVVITNSFFGTYFESYEVFFNQLFLENVACRPEMALSVSHLGLVPVYSQIAGLIAPLSVFSLIYSIYNSIFVFGVILLFYYSPYFKKSRFVLILVFVIVTFNIVFISNVRLSIGLGVLSYIYLFFSFRDSQNIDKPYFIAFLFFALFSLIVRLEMFVIVSLISSIFFLLWGFKKHAAISFTSLVFSFISFIVFNLMVFSTSQDKYQLHRAEHNIYDRGLLNNLLVEFDEDDAKLAGTYLFYLDSPHISIQDYKEINQSLKLFDYFTSKLFVINYIEKVQQIWQVIYDDFFWLLILNMFLFVGVLRVSSKNNRWRYPLFLTFILTIPLLLIIIVLVEKSFLAGYFSYLALFLSVILSLNYPYLSIKLKNIIRVLSLAMFVFFLANMMRYYKVERSISSQAGIFKSFVAKGNANETLTVVAFPSVDELYSNRLFSSQSKMSERHVYLNYFFFGYYDNFLSRQKEVFGSNFKSIKERVNFIINNKSNFVSNDFYNSMLKLYLQKVHDIQVDFIKQEQPLFKEASVYTIVSVSN